MQNFDNLINMPPPEDEEALHALKTLWATLPDIRLNHIQTKVYIGAWKGYTYQKISEKEGYDTDYLKDVGHRLWKQLAEEMREPISKHNFRSVISQRSQMLADAESGLQTETQPFVKRTMHVLPNLTRKVEKPIRDLRGLVDLSTFVGRKSELSQLKQWIVEDKNRLIGIFGLGGVGKTALAMRLLTDIEDQFDYVISRSLRNVPDFKSFVNSINETFAANTGEDICPVTIEDQIALLLQHLTQNRCLLIVDDWMSLLQTETSGIPYRQGYEPYGYLIRRLSEMSHQSCIVMTSREMPGGMAFKDTQSRLVKSLYLRGFSIESGLHFLDSMGISAPDAELEQLVRRYSGNPYALRVASTSINNVFKGSVSLFLGADFFIYGEIKGLIEQQFNRLSTLEKKVMDSLKAMSAEQLQSDCSLIDLMKTLRTETEPSALMESVEALFYRSFIQWNGPDIVQPQLLKEYMNSTMQKPFDNLAS